MNSPIGNKDYLVRDRLTRKNNPNVKNISHLDLRNSPEDKTDYMKALKD
jgi:hypothetical protein